MSDVVFPSETEGKLVGQHDDEVLSLRFKEAVRTYTEAAATGQSREWLSSYFTSAYPLDAPADVPADEVISDILYEESSRYGRRVSECSACGRLWVQTARGENAYRSYRPDDDDGYAAVLRGEHKQEQ